HFVLVGLCMCSFLLLAGCGGPKRKAVYPARGKILDAEGKPAVGGTIILHPGSAQAEDSQPKPPAPVDANGDFILTTYLENDGAPAGEYVATIEWRPVPKRPSEELPDRLEGKFRSVSDSPFRLTIEAKPNELAPIKLP